MNDFLKEKELLLDSIENNTSEHWKNYYKDVPIECIYDDLVIDINEIKRLQEENKKLQDRIEKALKYVEKMYDVIDYKDYPPYLDELYNVLRIETKEDNKED